jgi:hypothetical protein
LASFALIPIVKDEMSELTQNTKLYIVNRVNKRTKTQKKKAKPPKGSGIISGSSSNLRCASDEMGPRDMGPRDFRSSSHSNSNFNNFSRNLPLKVKTRTKKTIVDESFSDHSPLVEKN